MKTQLYFDLAGKTNHPRIHFRESKEVEEIMEDLRKENIAVFEIDGAGVILARRLVQSVRNSSEETKRLVRR
jgi:hypothetical protein